MRVRWGTLLKTAVLGLCVISVVAAISLAVRWAIELYPLFNDPYNDRPFDRAIWLSPASERDHNNPRSPMAGNARRQIHQGMTRKQVCAILGPPEHTNAWHGERSDEYYLGYCDSFLGAMDPDYLGIRYGKSGKVVRAEVSQY